MRNFDFSSWQGVLNTLLGLAIVTLIGVGIRVVMMLTIQQRRERMNRQINERLKTLIAAYKVLGGSFTGRLTVDPIHLRDLRISADGEGGDTGKQDEGRSSDRSRRIRDAVEAALADVILLGTAEHVRLASQAATDMVAGQPVHTAELVVSLRNFIRTALDLEPVSDEAGIPLQGPTRTRGGSGPGRGDGASAGNRGGAGGAGAGGMAGAGGAGMGMGVGLGIGHGDNDHNG